MATNPIADVSPEERPLTREEGFELLESLYGIFEGKFDQFGGAAAFYRSEHDAWTDDVEAA